MINAKGFWTLSTWQVQNGPFMNEAYHCSTWPDTIWPSGSLQFTRGPFWLQIYSTGAIINIEQLHMKTCLKTYANAMPRKHNKQHVTQSLSKLVKHGPRVTNFQTTCDKLRQTSYNRLDIRIVPQVTLGCKGVRAIPFEILRGDGLEKISDAPPYILFYLRTPPPYILFANAPHTFLFFVSSPPPLRISNGIALRIQHLFWPG